MSVVDPHPLSNLNLYNNRFFPNSYIINKFRMMRLQFVQIARVTSPKLIQMVITTLRMAIIMLARLPIIKLRPPTQATTVTVQMGAVSLPEERVPPTPSPPITTTTTCILTMQVNSPQLSNSP